MKIDTARKRQLAKVKQIARQVAENAEQERIYYLELAAKAAKRGNWRLVNKYERCAARKAEVIRKIRASNWEP